MEANQVETTQSVCPKCGKSVQSDFTRCPYCGAKLQVDPNDKVEKVKQGFFNFLSKAKDFFISAGKTIGKLAMSYKKITIAVSAVLILLIVLIPIITTFTNPLHPSNVTKVDVGVLTEQDVLDKYGEPYDKIDRFSTQGILLGPAIAMCREAWIYYDDAFMSKLKAFNKKVDNAESFEDLDKLDKEYNNLMKQKFDSLVVGIDEYDKVSFVCLNKNAKYDELDFFASKEPKELKNIELTKNTLCRGSSVAASNISYIAKYKDGSVVKAKITTNGTTNEEQTATKIDIQSIFGEYTVNLRMVDHSFDNNCVCIYCSKKHDLDNDCNCLRCHKSNLHQMSGCECINCGYDVHTPNSDCECTICHQEAHVLNNYCVCSQCEQTCHKYDSNQICKRCHTNEQGIRFDKRSTFIDNKKVFYYEVIASPKATGSIVIPSTLYGLPVMSIERDAFRDCSNLTNITIPDSVTNIGSNAFDGTAWYNNQPDGVVYAGKIAYKYKGSIPSDTPIIIKEGTLGLADSAFELCGLTSITIPDSVTSIGYSAFSDCSNLTSITIPDSVTSIEKDAFYRCRSLTSVTFEENSQLTRIENDAFYGCISLTSITIPNSVTSIGYYAFKDCSSLTSITIPDSVTGIGGEAFYGCIRLTSVTLGNSVNYIGENTFFDCHRLTSITIPDSVTRIEYEAFYNCWILTSINFNGTQAQWKAISKGSHWNYNTGNYTIYCTDGTISKFNS